MSRPPSQTPSAGQSVAHESAQAQIAGAAIYVDDMPEVRGTLYAAPILSSVAHGMILAIDTRAALAMPGVRDVILARDIPGDPVLANFRAHGFCGIVPKPYRLTDLATAVRNALAK